jgi:hypothetical protein
VTGHDVYDQSHSTPAETPRKLGELIPERISELSIE